MNRLDILKSEIEDVTQQESALFAEIVADSKNPDITENLLRQLVTLAVAHDDLHVAILDEIHKTSTPFWKRPFVK